MANKSSSPDKKTKKWVEYTEGAAINLAVELGYEYSSAIEYLESCYEALSGLTSKKEIDQITKDIEHSHKLHAKELPSIIDRLNKTAAIEVA